MRPYPYALNGQNGANKMASMTDYPKKALLIDGKFGSFTIYAMQYFLKYKAGGLYQRSCDGEWGYYTALALQYFLKNKGYYTYAVDGNAGERTWGALTSYIHAATGWHYIHPPLSWPTSGMTKVIQRWMNSVR